MTTPLTPPAPIPVPHIGPVVFVLDRTASMGTRDCLEGTMSRWESAVAALRATMDDMAQRDPNQRVKLYTCGTTVDRITNMQQMVEAVDVTNGDASFCIGQAALEAAWAAGDGSVVIIADGPPAQDSRVGELVLGNDIAMRALFSRTYFLTVGTVDEELRVFAERWPNAATLERAVSSHAYEPDGGEDGHYLADSERSEEYGATPVETADTEPPPPDLQHDGSVPLVVKTVPKGKRR